MGVVDLKQISLFRDIVRERSVTRGAGLNGVSQSAASQQIHELERGLGMQLLDRSTRPLKLTPAGRIYYDFCRDVLRRKDEFQVALDRLKRETESSVRIACIYSVGLSEMSWVEARFRQLHAEAELVVEYLRPERVYEAVADDRADLGLVSYPEPSKDIRVIPWRQEVMVLVAPAEHPLGLNTFLSPEQLGGLDFVAFDDDLPVARALRRFFREHSVDVNVVMHFDNVLMIKEAVAMGSGVSILPERAISHELAQGRLIGIPLESPGLYRPLGIIHHRSKRFSPAVRSFLDLLARHADEPQPPRLVPRPVAVTRQAKGNQTGPDAGLSFGMSPHRS